MSDRVAYFDCFSGASGDMILGALVDCGLSLERLQGTMANLECGPIQLRAERVRRAGIAATRVQVQAPREHPTYRGLPEIREIISRSAIEEPLKARAIQVFARLAEAEAAVHNVPVEQVHFHEVGAHDAIADIVGAVAGLVQLGDPQVMFSRLRLGSGSVRAGHGVLPVPAPATARLVAGVECEIGPVERELLTPTGAALLTTLGRQTMPPAMRIEKVGYGAGAHDDPDYPNVLRLILGRPARPEEADAVWVLEANLDDTTAEVCGHAIERLLAAGALDAYAVPIQMKKSRPGWMLCALVEDHTLQRVEEVFFAETTTFGVRRYRTERSKLARETRLVETPYGAIRVKIGTRDGQVITASPEYEDCRRIALEKNISLRRVMEAAQRASLQRQ